MIELNCDNFQLNLAKYKTSTEGKSVYQYSLTDKGVRVFSGKDFEASPLYDPDSPEAIEALLEFLCLGSEDVEDEYFEDYSIEQIKWRDSRRIDLISVKENLNEGRGQRAEGRRID